MDNLSAPTGQKISGLCFRWMQSSGSASGRLCIFAVTPDNELVGVWHNLPSGAWKIFDASAELGFDVHPWVIPAPTTSGGIQHLMMVRG